MLKSLNKGLLILLRAGLLAISVLAVVILVFTFLNLMSRRSFFSWVLPIPSSESIGQRYLNAVVRKDSNYIEKRRDALTVVC